jgi:3-hydroxyisobutyrate dehydrogenase-like beta-hydroxyacid dehydrogenase
MDALALVQRAGIARTRVRQAQKMMRAHPHSFGWVKQYVMSSTAQEEAELALLRMRKDLS